MRSKRFSDLKAYSLVSACYQRNKLIVCGRSDLIFHKIDN
jgi:hypothetical protein